MIPGVHPDAMVYLNGEILPVAEAKISVLDRGFIFGDGVYDVVPAYRGKPFRMEGHLARLMRGLKRLRIESPLDEAGWEDLVRRLLELDPQPASMVYLQVTRGVAKREHVFPAGPISPTVFAMASPFTRPGADLREQGLSLIGIADERWLHCDLKSISLLGNILARQQAADAGVHEVVQFRDGFLTEGASCNIWVVRDGKLLAPPRDRRILEGIRYGLLAELAEEAGVPFEARPIARQEVYEADELLLTSASREVLPVTTLDGQPVGSGKPGPVYARLQAGYDARIAAL